MISIWNKLKDHLDMDSSFVFLFEKYFSYYKEEQMHPKLFTQRRIEKAISSYKPGDFNKIYDIIPAHKKHNSTPIINLFLLKMIFNGRITINDDHLYIYMFDNENKDIDNFLRLFEIVDRDLDLKKARSLFNLCCKIKTHENHFFILYFLVLLNHDRLQFENEAIVSKLVNNISAGILNKKMFEEKYQLAIDSLVKCHQLFPENYSNPIISNNEFKNRLETYQMLNMPIQEFFRELDKYSIDTKPMISENISIL